MTNVSSSRSGLQSANTTGAGQGRSPRRKPRARWNIAVGSLAKSESTDGLTPRERHRPTNLATHCGPGHLRRAASGRNGCWPAHGNSQTDKRPQSDPSMDGRQITYEPDHCSIGRIGVLVSDFKLPMWRSSIWQPGESAVPARRVAGLRQSSSASHKRNPAEAGFPVAAGRGLQGTRYYCFYFSLPTATFPLPWR